MSLRDLLERERRAIARLLGASGAAVAAGTVAVLLALGTALLGDARWLVLPRVVPVLLWLGAFALVVVAIRAVRRHLQNEATLASVAAEIERERALRDGSVRGAVEVADKGSLGRLNAEQVVERLGRGRERTLVPAFRRRVVRALAMGGIGTLAGIGILALASAVAPDGWAALLHPVRAWRGTLLDEVRLEVPNAVMRGERLTVEASAPGRRMVTISHRRTGSSWRSVRVPVTDGRAKLQLDPIDADLSIVATDGRAVSDTALVRMVERPFVGDVTVRAQFPRYLERPPEVVALGEPARIPQGTLLTIEGQSSTELADVQLVDAENVIRLDVTGRRFTGRFTVRTSGRFEWRANGRSGPIADVPQPLDLDVLPDSAPQVDIVSPANDTTITAGDTVALSVLATDDYGIASITVRSWIMGQGAERRARPAGAQVPVNQPHWAGALRVATDELQPGEALVVVAAATDGSPWQQVGESRELILRLPTLSEQRSAAREAADSAVQRAAAAAEAQRQLQQRTSNASRERTDRGQQSGSERNMSYEASEQARSLADEQRQLAERVDDLRNTTRQLEQQLRQAGALDSALQSRLDEVERLLSDALTPELAEQLRKLEQASQQLSQEDARKAMADLAEQQRRLRDQLEKSVEMLRRAALEGAMTTLRDEAQELAQRERQLAESLAARQDETTRREARELAERSRNLSEDVRQLEQRLRQERAETGAARVDEAERQVQRSARNMERAAQSQTGERQTAARPDSQRTGDPARAGQQSDRQQAGQQRADSQQANRQQADSQQANQQQTGGRGGSQQQDAGRQGRGQQANQQTAQQGNQQGNQQDNQQGAQQQGGRQGGEQRAGNQGGTPSAQDAARQAADAMEQASRELAQAREQQVGEWKQELTGELDRAIQEMIQLSREQDRLEQQARQGTSAEDLRAQQGTLQQGVEKTAQRLQEQGQRTSLLSQRSLRSVNDARRQVEEATRQTQTSTNPNQVASAMRDASDALNQAAVSLVRDRERAESANSASGFSEMLQQLQQMAQQQAGLNSETQSLLPMPGTQLGAAQQQQARQLGREQREVAAQLDDVADRDASGRAEELAREARQIAQALESARLDPNVLERQQRLFRRMLDAGRLMEQDEREDTGRREATAWRGTEVFTPQGSEASGRSAARFQPPSWNELRSLTPEERRLVLEYFRKINGGQRP